LDLNVPHCHAMAQESYADRGSLNIPNLLQCSVYITFLSSGDVNIQNSKTNEANYLSRSGTFRRMEFQNCAKNLR